MRRILRVLPLALFWVVATSVVAEAESLHVHVESGDSTISAPVVKKNLYRKFRDWLDHTNDSVVGHKAGFDFIGAPYYAEDVKFAIGLLGTSTYYTAPDKPEIPASWANLKLQLSTTLYYSATLYGDHYFPSGQRKLNYYFKFQSFPTYFWGTGYDEGYRGVRSDFRELSLNLKADFFQRIKGECFIGPTVDLKWMNANKRRNHLEKWDGYPLHTLSAGIGVAFEYDTRDYITGPGRGAYLRLTQLFFPRFLGNGERSFGQTELYANWYKGVWKDGILAMQLHGNLTYGKTPWGMMPTFGDGSMRGYYIGRYRDKCEADATIELRQHVYKRGGAVVWIGAGSVASDPGGFIMKQVLPNAGIGYRFEFKRHMNIRLDFGVGKRTWGFEFNINECF